MRILLLIARLLQAERPLPLYGFIGALFAAVGLILGIPVIVSYLHTGLVERFPTAFLSASLMIIAMMCFVVGVILTGVRRGRKEAVRLAYLR
ncbi:MAG: hypothetical protein FWG08_00065 [Propionibacteriaceae bacterium]|nr:hypothetical protein [Propionibacteriaceae bacterium]